MRTIAVSRFKATCLDVIEQVRRTGEPVTITKRGVPVVRLVPAPVARVESRFGCMKGSAEDVGDIVGPLPERDWEALR